MGFENRDMLFIHQLSIYLTFVEVGAKEKEGLSQVIKLGAEDRDGKSVESDV